MHEACNLVTSNMHTRSITMGWPKAIHLGNKTLVLDNMLAVSATREESVNIGLYKDETGGALSLSTKKRVVYQRKTWSIAECNELRKRRDEGQGFSGLATVRTLLITCNYEAVPFIDITTALWCIGFRRNSAILQGQALGR